jgi:hypothetical protein
MSCWAERYILFFFFGFLFCHTANWLHELLDDTLYLYTCQLQRIGFMSCWTIRYIYIPVNYSELAQ